jgi:hypothetical protein
MGKSTEVSSPLYRIESFWKRSCVLIRPCRDDIDDYLTLDPKSGELKAYLSDHNLGEGEQKYGKVKFNPIGIIATGLGPGKNVRIADIDGDGVSKQNTICAAF